MRRAERSPANGVASASRQRSTTHAHDADQAVVRAAPRSRPRGAFNGVQVFSATVASERAHLGDRVTQWRAEHPAVEIVDLVVTQSSDAAFHCLTISVFYWEASSSRRAAAR
jgi:hypothetical protein